jgi:hypothetical protein
MTATTGKTLRKAAALTGAAALGWYLYKKNKPQVDNMVSQVVEKAKSVDLSDLVEHANFESAVRDFLASLPESVFMPLVSGATSLLPTETVQSFCNELFDVMQQQGIGTGMLAELLGLSNNSVYQMNTEDLQKLIVWTQQHHADLLLGLLLKHLPVLEAMGQQARDGILKFMQS